MKIRVNGDEYSTDAANLASLLEELSIKPERVAVELNLRIVKKTELEKQLINEGDTIEIVNFVGGG